MSTAICYPNFFCRVPVLDKEGKSTRDVVLIHISLFPGAKIKGIVKSSNGFDLSKAFDRVDRYKVLELLEKEDLGKKRQCCLNGTTLQVKRGKQKRRNFRNTRGFPQGNASPRSLSTLYLDEALRDFDSLRIFREPRQLQLYGHDYAPRT